MFPVTECLLYLDLKITDHRTTKNKFLTLQLGPVLQSAFAKQYGLELSFLERLSCNFLYMRDEVRFTDHGCYDPVLVTKLVRNYR